MTFDTSTLHSMVYVSGDNRTLSSHSSSKTPNSSDGVNQLLKYRGVVANICLENNTKMYYEVTYEYEMLLSLDVGLLVLEVGVAEPDLIDHHHKASSKKVGVGRLHSLNVKRTIAFAYGGDIWKMSTSKKPLAMIQKEQM